MILALAGVLSGSGLSAAFADGLYLRGGIGLDRSLSTAFLDDDCASTSPDALYGCGTGGDGSPYRSLGRLGPDVQYELGLGTTIGPVLRLEILMSHAPALAFAGTTNFLGPDRQQSVSAQVASTSGTGVVYVDFPNGGSNETSRFRPFLGIGLGYVHNRIGTTRMTFPKTETKVPGATWSGFGWRLMFGAAAGMGKRMILELAWHYADRGLIKTGTGTGSVDWKDGTQTLPLDLAPTRARLQGHGLQVSLRVPL